MKQVKYPGYAFKLSWWHRLVNWYYNWRWPLQGIDILKHTRENQLVLDFVYNLIIENQKKSLLPPIKIKK